MIVIFDKNPEIYAKLIEDNKLFPRSAEEVLKYNQTILNELRTEFKRLGITPDYRLSEIGVPDASGWDGGLCMHEEDDFWLVYQSERSNRDRPQIFTNIRDAANYFLWFHISRQVEIIVT
jgi:hypothetical protein